MSSEPYQGLRKNGWGRGALSATGSYADAAKTYGGGGCVQHVPPAANVAHRNEGPPPPPLYHRTITTHRSYEEGTQVVRSKLGGNDSSGVKSCFGDAGYQFEADFPHVGVGSGKSEMSSNGATTPTTTTNSQQQSTNLMDSELDELCKKYSPPPLAPSMNLGQDQYPEIGWKAEVLNGISEKTSSTTTSIPLIPSRLSKPSQPKPPSESARVAPIYFRINEELAKKASSRNFSVIFYTKEDGKHHRDIPLISKVDNWDWNGWSTVRIPLSPNYTKGFRQPQPLWPVIVTQLMEFKDLCQTNGETLIQNPVSLQDEMLNTLSAYCGDLARDNQTNFEIVKDEGLRRMLVGNIPTIVDFALKLPSLLEKPVPLLKKGQPRTIYLTKQLCASLLANAFFCTIPKPERNMPDFNFFRLFNLAYDDTKAGVKAEKLKCILNYFREMGKRQVDDDSIISFERRNRTNVQHWGSSRRKLLPHIVFSSDMKIEEADGYLQVDFANKLVGGGVLNDGAVMEEIRFSICPELIVARLFTEALDDNEVLVVTGTEQFSKYRGYGTSFKFAGSPKDLREKNLDNLGRIRTQVVAMDALYFSPGDAQWKQYSKFSIDRELYKCFVAFQRGPTVNTPIATGNWGCGAFNGDPELKLLIQWMAASEVERQGILYCTGDAEQSRNFEEIQKLLVAKYTNVGELYKDVVSYDDCKHRHKTLFDFLLWKNKSFYERLVRMWNKMGE